MTESKKKYAVELPITGSIYIEVEADSEEAALEAAWDAYGEGWEDAGFESEWEATTRVTSGNVCHAMLNEQCASEIK